MLDTLLTTLIREMQNDNTEGRRSEARTVTRRFLRSVARIFVVLNIEMTPATNKKKRSVIRYSTWESSARKFLKLSQK